MFQDFKKENNSYKQLEKNLKLMGLSAVVLVVLFVYTIYKSDTSIQGTSYYFGLFFLFIMLFLSLALNKYKDKIRKMVPKNRFQQELQMASQNQESFSESKDQIEISSNISPIKSNVTFKDIAGIESIKEELEEIVDFLNHPKKYQEYNISLPKGVLLVGPPGVGKTLIAKAVASQADVPFFYQSGASFVHIYVGMGAKKVRELFSAARSCAPSIVFIDEIDAVGKKRGIGSNDEREATLNELLTQMDGFGSSSGVMVIAATNKIEVLDEALLRAGRFDRRVFIDLPNKEDRKKILHLYLKQSSYEFDLEKLVDDTSGFNSSSLATLVNEALLNMIKRDAKKLSEDDITIAKQKVQFGKKHLQILNHEQKEILATYQAGKAFITQTTTKLFDEGVRHLDRVFPSKNELEHQIQSLLAGKITLEVVYSQPFAIFENDIKQAYEVASKMVDVYKMEDDIDHLIKIQKDRLIHKIQSQKSVILELKNKMLKDEIIVF
ncbi:MAG: AAA family ATPase [Campylobacterales bacterium]|nr:AAA family ATPase [Campylobacterales bacterium]